MAENSFDNPMPCPSKPGKQAGYDIVIGTCLRCGRKVALNQPGRHLCDCHTWIFLDPEKFPEKS